MYTYIYRHPLSTRKIYDVYIHHTRIHEAYTNTWRRLFVYETRIARHEYHVEEWIQECIKSVFFNTSQFFVKWKIQVKCTRLLQMRRPFSTHEEYKVNNVISSCRRQQTMQHTLQLTRQLTRQLTLLHTLHYTLHCTLHYKSLSPRCFKHLTRLFIKLNFHASKNPKWF